MTGLAPKVGWASQVPRSDGYLASLQQQSISSRWRIGLDGALLA